MSLLAAAGRHATAHASCHGSTWHLPLLLLLHLIGIITTHSILSTAPWDVDHGGRLPCTAHTVVHLRIDKVGLRLRVPLVRCLLDGAQSGALRSGLTLILEAKLVHLLHRFHLLLHDWEVIFLLLVLRVGDDDAADLASSLVSLLLRCSHLGLQCCRVCHFFNIVRMNFL